LLAVVVRKTKPPQASPTFEKMNLDRMKQCADTAESAKQVIETSKRLADHARELMDSIQQKKRRAS
jgi:hypothetical protein